MSTANNDKRYSLTLSVFG